MFTIITDTSANLPAPLLAREEIDVIPFSYFTEGEERTCLDTEAFDDKAYYGMIRAGGRVTTSQITPQSYLERFAPALEQGGDILFISMSSGISGSFASAGTAARLLRERYPDRTIRLVDTLGASLGEGLLVLEALQYREQGKTVHETADLLEQRCQSMCQIFTVDDLMHLRRNGRLSSAGAILGTVLGVKPLLKGDTCGRIVTCGKVRGRRNAVRALAEHYDRLVRSPETQTVGIAHADCPEDAALLAELLNRNNPPRDILTVKYEPVTGSHVGPGALALFFFGDEHFRAEGAAEPKPETSAVRRSPTQLPTRAPRGAV